MKRQIHREAHGLPRLEGFFQDLRFASRGLRRDPWFTLVAISILSLGIASNTTVFSVVNALLLRPLPVKNPGEIVWISNQSPAVATSLSSLSPRIDVFEGWQERSTSFSEMAAYNAFFTRGSYRISGDLEPEFVHGVRVTYNLFPMLGLKPAAGRFFAREEALPGAPAVAVISYGLWQRRFGTSPGIVGRSVALEDSPVTVIGVLPREFDFGSVFAPGTRVDLFIPAVFEQMRNWGNTLAVLARLAPGVSLPAAQAELDQINPRLRAELPGLDEDDGAFLTPLSEHVRGDLRTALLLIWGSVAMVMLIVCANLSNLLLARASTRHQEVAVRTALGAGRFRIAGQMLTECLLLSLLGAFFGTVLAYLGSRLIAQSNALSIPLLESIRVDTKALAFTVAMSLGVAILFGILPAWKNSTCDLGDSLRENSRGSSHKASTGWLRSGLVVVELALAGVLLVGAGLLLRSFGQLQAVDLGFRPEGVTAFRIDPSRGRFDSQRKLQSYYPQLLESVRSLPSVVAASTTDVLPLGSHRTWGVRRNDQSGVDQQTYVGAFVRLVGSDYLRTMGIALLSGRDIGIQDRPDSERVVVINRRLARALFDRDDVIDRQVSIGDQARRVVGVVSDVRYGTVEEAPRSEFYLPQTQSYMESLILVVRSALPPESLASSVGSQLRRMDPTLPVSDFESLETFVARATSPRRFFAELLSGFSLLALALACLGVYGIVSYSVSQRRLEIGIRMALGATRRDILGRVLGQTLKLSALGVFVGLLASLASSKLIAGLLFNVDPVDPPTLAAMTAVLIFVTLLAGYLPARRASTTAPLSALRSIR